ncbi:unnamed protein product [Colletotrichum noveboracense]|uniref:Uncharacterized protein n=1 Tax=Colletotrichum noveboracense TaxID=2664923 RepID=A0A9W4WHT2_9PEZI|nr:hypothetical protein K456DRAFT_1729536 [Colletotrichum gloeosporioides 23]KAJ0270312.1 hypothetical protein COL940_011772 [Colletotrichum noveboracense]KAJ0289533.1 hypothetical protein CBS470a_004343 [Colletotrichum nupharicola]KAJ0314710.1 hypothetical protein Brms1b_006630 [Colletotrichum noveboracense]CAI0652814.1 unnamed protein product [Colletotrichum noveboracense]
MTSTILPTLKRWLLALAETYFWLFVLYLTMWFTMAFGKILVWLILLILGYRDGQGPVCGSPAWLLDIYFPEEEIVAGVRFGVFLFFVACWVGIL